LPAYQAAALNERLFNIASLAGRGGRHEELDQIVMALLRGAE
jgi:hypothetical protein